MSYFVLNIYLLHITCFHEFHVNGLLVLYALTLPVSGQSFMFNKYMFCSVPDYAILLSLIKNIIF